MPTLDWIGKKSVINHHSQVPFHLLKEEPELSVGEAGSGNLLVEGDNLLALKALLPYYAGQVKCIYIDPPYNTGNEGWIYNDNVNSPEIRKWLGKVVGRDMEDLTRHDKWLCMMYPRLALLRELLREDGAIFVSIDDNEAFSLKYIMDEIFGPSNFLCSFAWEKRYAPPPDTKDIGYLHETVLAYRKTSSFQRHLLPPTSAQLGRYKNPDNDRRGPWKAMDYTCRFSKQERPNLYYGIRNPFTDQEVWPSEKRVWACTVEETRKNEIENRLWWGKNGTAKVPAKKNFLSDVQKGIMPTTLLRYSEVGHTHEATKELLNILPKVKMTPKPSRLVMHLCGIASERDSLILDSFAGSGTTAHAVMKLNQQDGGWRRFILVELDSDICHNVTAERLKSVCLGYRKPDGAKVEGLGGGFRFCKLGAACFDEHGRVNPEVKFPDLARHVFFTETGEPIPKQARANNPLIGIYKGTAVYLLYNGILKDRLIDGGNVLTQAVLDELPKHDGPKIIYGAACRFSFVRLKRENIIFKQIPYQIRVH